MKKEMRRRRRRWRRRRRRRRRMRRRRRRRRSRRRSGRGSRRRMTFLLNVFFDAPRVLMVTQSHKMFMLLFPVGTNVRILFP